MPNEWLSYARHDPNYAIWLGRVDQLCRMKIGLTLHQLDPEILSAGEFHERGVSVEDYVEYVSWFLRVDSLCVRFLYGCHFWVFDPNDYPAQEYFEEGWSAEEFFVVIVIETLRNEYPDIDELVGEAAVWGSERPGDWPKQDQNDWPRKGPVNESW